jgi:hypothetical protein
MLMPVIHRIVRNLPDASIGVFEDTHARLALAKYLQENPQYRMTAMEQAKREYARYQKILSPRPASPGGFYHPERLVPASPSKSIFMAKVGLVQLDFWKDKHEEAKRHADEAHAKKTDYWETRRRALIETGLTNLNDVECAVFGYKPRPVPTMPDEIFTDDGDDEDDV